MLTLFRWVPALLEPLNGRLGLGVWAIPVLIGKIMGFTFP